MPEISRRTALAFGLGTVGVATLGIAANPESTAAALGAVRAGFAQPVIPARSVFAGSVGEVFTATGSGTSFPVTLAAIRDLTPVLVADDEDRFNLHFESTDPAFEQGIYRLVRAGVPVTELFVSPVDLPVSGASGDVRTLQALVNRQA